MSKPVRIGTRGSRLALWQAEYVAGLLRGAAGLQPVELVEIETAGDQDRDQPLTRIGGIGVFTKEIQRALLAGTVDIAVHSLKDLPTVPVDGLTLAAVPERGPSGDVFISPKYPHFDELPAGGVVATGSLRRQSMLLHRRPDLRLVHIRGNLDTRLRKLVEDKLDALVLAEAGLVRLGLGQHIRHLLDPEWMLPAVGQGAIGIECRSDDRATLSLAASVDHLATHRAVIAERSFLAGLGGGCLVPIGARATVAGDEMNLRGAVLSPAGTQRIDGSIPGPASDAASLGRKLADLLLSRGAAALLQR
jgi:hydroxymethylbilane synthase